MSVFRYLPAFISTYLEIDMLVLCLVLPTTYYSLFLTGKFSSMFPAPRLGCLSLLKLTY